MSNEFDFATGDRNFDPSSSLIRALTVIFRAMNEADRRQAISQLSSNLYSPKVNAVPNPFALLDSDIPDEMLEPIVRAMLRRATIPALGGSANEGGGVPSGGGVTSDANTSPNATAANSLLLGDDPSGGHSLPDGEQIQLAPSPEMLVGEFINRFHDGDVDSISDLIGVYNSEGDVMTGGKAKNFLKKAASKVVDFYKKTPAGRIVSAAGAVAKKVVPALVKSPLLKTAVAIGAGVLGGPAAAAAASKLITKAQSVIEKVKASPIVKAIKDLAGSGGGKTAPAETAPATATAPTVAPPAPVPAAKGSALEELKATLGPSAYRDFLRRMVGLAPLEGDSGLFTGRGSAGRFFSKLIKNPNKTNVTRYVTTIGKKALAGSAIAGGSAATFALVNRALDENAADIAKDAADVENEEGGGLLEPETGRENNDKVHQEEPLFVPSNGVGYSFLVMREGLADRRGIDSLVTFFDEGNSILDSWRSTFLAVNPALTMPGTGDSDGHIEGDTLAAETLLHGFPIHLLSMIPASSEGDFLLDVRAGRTITSPPVTLALARFYASLCKGGEVGSKILLISNGSVVGRATVLKSDSEYNVNETPPIYREAVKREFASLVRVPVTGEGDDLQTGRGSMLIRVPNPYPSVRPFRVTGPNIVLNKTQGSLTKPGNKFIDIIRRNRGLLGTTAAAAAAGAGAYALGRGTRGSGSDNDNIITPLIDPNNAQDVFSRVPGGGLLLPFIGDSGAPGMPCAYHVGHPHNSTSSGLSHVVARMAGPGSPRVLFSYVPMLITEVEKGGES